MSLLIKALDKAESDKVEHTSSKQKQAEKNKAKAEPHSDLELSLSPADSVLAESAPVAKASDVGTQSTIQTSSQATSQLVRSATAPSNTSTSSNSPKSAANVFSAKGVEVANQNTRLALIGGAGLVVLLGMGLYFYQFVDNTPDVVIPPRPLTQAQEQAPERLLEPLQEMPVTETQAFELDEIAPLPEQQVAPIKMAKKQAASENEELAEAAQDEAMPEEMMVDETVVATKANKKGNKSKSLQFGDVIASRSASIEVTKTQSAVGINPVLMSAYEAYNAGDDAKAQKLYKQVLQQDVRNVDALLGLGAIASRQGREADANDWFGKVLEIDPRNNMAQAALLENQSQGNEVSSESRIKNMLAKNPNDANLHVALGNLYAEQNQWPAAQQAYFDAYSLNGSADNAFNLAVSLDHMGKPKQALPYYQRALAQASNSSSIDKATLEARIAAIQ
jgi:tetratricopeptide (TPR) repeat protein